MKQEWVCDTSKGGIACGGCSSCKAKADEKVLDYLERANNLYKKMDINTRIGLGKNWLIEIAKLLQRESK